MEEEVEAEIDRFTFVDAISASWEWLEQYTRLVWLLLIGIIICVISPLVGWLEWAEVLKGLWIFPFVFGSWLIIAVIFYLKYDFKVVVESEVEAKEYKERLVSAKKWISSGRPRMIVQMKWKKLQKSS